MGRTRPPEDGRHTTDVGPARGWRRLDFVRERLDAVLAAHDAALKRQDGRVAKRGRKSRVTRHGDVVVKEHVPLGAWGHLRSRLAPSRHAAGWLHAYRLLALGVATARPMAFLRQGGRVFVVYEDLSRLPRLDLYVFGLYGREDGAVRDRLRDAVATWLGTLHRRGVYHGDLKGSNVLVRENGGTLEFPLIDTDHVRFFPHPVDDRRRTKNLAQLGASIPVAVNRAERLRFYHAYVDAFGPAPSAKDAGRAVASQLARKTLVVDRPIE